MSAKLASAKGLVGRNLQYPTAPTLTPWVRNPSWTALPDVAGLAKFVGLHAVFPDANFLAVNASGSSGYTVDWGDGTPTENIATGVQANHQYDFTAAGLAGTDAPVTFNSAFNTVNRTAHGYTNGMEVSFYNIVTTADVYKAFTYYVISATANTFQISLEPNGSPISLTPSGSATLLPYKLAIVSIVPQGEGTFTALNLNVKHAAVNGVTLPAYTSGFLDISVAGTALTTLAIGGTTILMNNLEQAQLIDSNAITNFSNLFSTCRSLQSLPVLNTASGTDFTSMFNTCTALQTVSLVNTASGTNFSSMFLGCVALQTVSLPNTALVNTFTSMFNGCLALQTVPLFNTASGTNFTSMFNGCVALQTVPLFNTALGTNFTSMFNGCSALQTVPLFNTALVTTFSSMFSGCVALQTVPLFNTASSGIFSSMFNSCLILQTVPLFNTASGTNFSSMFANCRTLQAVPLFSTALGTNFTGMFNGCSTLQTAPLFNTASGTNFSSMFNSCLILQTVPLFNTASGTNFGSMFAFCRTLQTVPLFNTALTTDFSNMFNTCPALQTVPLFNTTSGTTFTGMFTSCAALIEGKLANTKRSISYDGCKLSKTALEDIFNGLAKAAGAQTFNIGTNFGAPAVVSRAGTTTSGSTVVTMASTTGITVGMQVTGTNSPLTTAAAVTLQDVGDTVTRTAHGLSNDDEMSFATIVTTTGITTFTIYFAVNATANTFQIALTSGGAAINLTTNGSGTILYRTTVSSIDVNVSVTLSRPATATGATTLGYRLLATGTALLKGFTVAG